MLFCSEIPLKGFLLLWVHFSHEEGVHPTAGAACDPVSLQLTSMLTKVKWERRTRQSSKAWEFSSPCFSYLSEVTGLEALGVEKRSAGRNLLVSKKQHFVCFYMYRFIHPYFPLPQRPPVYVLERIPLLNRALTSLDSRRGNVSTVYVLLWFLSLFNLETAFPLAVQGVPCFLCFQLSE